MIRNAISFLSVLTLFFAVSQAQGGQVGGTYTIDTETLVGDMIIKELSTSKISFDIKTMRYVGNYTAVIDGEADLDGDVASFKNEEGCMFTITFYKNKAVVEGADATCRYKGANAVIDGNYHKKKK